MLLARRDDERAEAEHGRVIKQGEKHVELDPLGLEGRKPRKMLQRRLLTNYKSEMECDYSGLVNPEENFGVRHETFLPRRTVATYEAHAKKWGLSRLDL